MSTGVQGQRSVGSAEILMAIAQNDGVGYGLDFFNCDLRRVELRKANLSGANLQQTSLQEADLTLVVAENARMRESCLERADLRGANLRGADLQNAKFSGANLQGARLGGAYLYGAELRGAKNLTRIEIEEGPGEEIGSQKNYLYAKEVYLNLKNYFLDMGRYDDAGWAFVKERRMERRTYFPPHARFFYERELASAVKLDSVLMRGWLAPYMTLRHSWFYFKYLWKWIASWLYDLICGYGEQPWKVVLVSLAVVVIYGIVYWRINLLEYLGEQAEVLGLVGQSVPLLVCLYFSFLAFNSVVFGGILPRLDALPQVIAGSEAFVGVFLTSLFILAMGRKIGGR